MIDGRSATPRLPANITVCEGQLDANQRGRSVGQAWRDVTKIHGSDGATGNLITAPGQGRPDSFASTLEVERSAVGSGSGRLELERPRASSTSKIVPIARFCRPFKT